MSEELTIDEVRNQILRLLYPNRSFHLTRIAQELDVSYNKMYTASSSLIKSGLVVSVPEVLDKGRIGRAGIRISFLG